MEDDRVPRIWEECRSNERISILVATRHKIVLIEALVRVLQYRGMRTEILHQLDDPIPR